MKLTDIQKTQKTARISRLLSLKKASFRFSKKLFAELKEGIFLFLNQINPKIKASIIVKIKMFGPVIALNKDRI